MPDTTKMNTAEIIQNTYVEYLPDGTKRDRYRKEFLKKLQLTNNETTKRKREEQETETTKQKTKVEPQQDNSQLNTQATQQETTYIENERNQRYAKLPQTKIEQIREEENLTTKPNTTKTIYASYREHGVFEWSINTSERITQRNQTPDYHIDEEYEW